MRTESRFLLGAGAFALVVAVIYWFISYEDAGFVLLALMGVCSALIGGYLLYRAHSHRRAEDDPDADYGDPSQNAAWLRDALDAVLAGRAPDQAETDPVGCSIKWK